VTAKPRQRDRLLALFDPLFRCPAFLVEAHHRSVMEATQGWSAVDTSAVYLRARSLAERGGRAESLQIFNGLYSAAITRDELRPALALAEQMFEIARGIGTPGALARAHNALALPRHYLGDLAGARYHFLQVIEYYREDSLRGIPDDPGVDSRIFAGHNEWYLGHPDRCVRYAEEATSMARRQNNPALLAFALSIVSHAHELRGDFQRSLEAGEEAVKLATASQFPLLNAVGKIRIAWARAQVGEAEAAVEQIRGVLAEFDVLQFFLARTSFLACLGEAQALAGATSDALVTVERALQSNPDELLYRPSVLRLRGELKLQNVSGLEAAEQDFREAIEVARRMGAKSPELRATLSLARVLRDTRRRHLARAMLAEIYDWFTEGFDTADLKDAKALLDELGA
jgi:tetratricopeptide (TPR) repeat protein